MWRGFGRAPVKKHLATAKTSVLRCRSFYEDPASDCRLYVFPSSIRTAQRGDVRVRERGSVLENLPFGAAAIGGALIRDIDSKLFLTGTKNPGGENPGDRLFP
jgi:hypothetical protein